MQPTAYAVGGGSDHAKAPEGRKNNRERMNALHTSAPPDQKPTLVRVARFPRLRALTWDRDVLYASRGYELMRVPIKDVSNLNWASLATFRPNWKRRLSATTRLTARLFRDGFHALAVLADGALVAAVPGSILNLRPGETEFHQTHAITRGTRPLHITAVPDGTVYWGEYFDNASRDEVHIYASSDGGTTWNIAYTFPKRSIRHVHNIIHDPWQSCLWILTGDYADECRILRATCDLSRVETVLQGKQQARAVAAVPAEDALYFSSDTPLEQNYIYRLDHQGALSQLAAINSSSIYGCRVGAKLFFSTMVEPSEVNRDRTVRVYAADTRTPNHWRPQLEWGKDPWPMSFFQYGNAFLPDGNNTTQYLAMSTVAVIGDDMVTSLYSVDA